MRVCLLSLFPGYFTSPLETSLIGRARESGLVDVQLVDIRDYASLPHATVDDRAYGGGPGMVLMAEPVAAAIRDMTSTSTIPPSRRRVLYMTPQGAPLTAQRCRGFAEYEELIILCGHYEGVDERLIQALVDEEVSIGDYVITNGCLSALVVLDATLRFVPGVVGKEASIQEDSFEQGIFDHPHYTRPPLWEGRPVPPVLLSGDHEEIARWRKTQALDKTAHVRPDLFLRHVMQNEKCDEKEEESSALKASLPSRMETMILQAASLKQTKRFYREALRWKPMTESKERLVFSLGGTQQLIFVESRSQTLNGLENNQLDSQVATKGMTFTIPSHAMRLDKGLIATASGYRMKENQAKGLVGKEVEIEMIWWQDPDGYRWLFTPSNKKNEEKVS